jgi:glycine cleavage system H protein
MAIVRGCNLPDELFYHVESNVWARREADGTLIVGMTSYACALAGQLVAATPKKAGKEVEQNKTICTVESGKWVGPVKAPVSGELLEMNEAVSNTPALVNEDPYGRGWMAKMKPSRWDAEVGSLVSGLDIATVFEAKMNADGFGGC